MNPVESVREAIDFAGDLICQCDLISRTHGMIMTWVRADWKGAYRRRGVLGLVTEFVSCVTSHASPTIYLDRYECGARGIRGIDVEWLLKRHGIRIWDRGLMGRTRLFFCVERRQVAWAEYVLHRAGVPLMMKDNDPRNRVWAARHEGRPEPAACARQARQAQQVQRQAARRQAQRPMRGRRS